MARRHTKGRVAPPAECPVLVSKVPETQGERDELTRRCLKHAKSVGLRGKLARLAATRYYNAAIAEARGAVRNPATQPSVLSRPGAAVPVPPVPRGMEQTDSGLYVPAGAQ